MAMIRWNPFAEPLSLRDAIDRLFDEAVWRPGAVGTPAPGQGFVPALDVSETPDEYVVKAGLPGVKPEDVAVDLRGNSLTISGATQEEQERQDGHYHIRERHAGRFARSISLPIGVDAERAEAQFENGLLTVRLPKADEAKPHRI